MTDVWTTAEPTIVTHVKTITGVAGCGWGRCSNYKTAHVQLDWGPMDLGSELNNNVDIHQSFNARIHAKSSSEALAVYQSLLTLWLTPTHRDALAALGIYNIQPTVADPPIKWQSPQAGETWLDVQFDIEMTLTY
jgi:hypothetical protein